MVFLQATDLIKIYEDENKVAISALRGLHLQVEKSSLVSIYGPSGNGKSTLLNILSGTDKPTAGNVVIEQFGDISKFSKKELSKYLLNCVGILNQSSRANVIYNWSVKENILFPMKLAGSLSHEQCLKRAVELLKSVDLMKRINFKTNSLSGGERQRLGLAVALANSPQLLLADEPTGEIDSENAKHIVCLLKKIRSENGTTIVIVTHDPIVANSSDIAWNIKDGRIIGLHQAIKSIITDKQVERKYYTTVDDHGNLRLPENLRKKANIGTRISIEYNQETNKLELSKE